jgi:serine/threonine protein kinase
MYTHIEAPKELVEAFPDYKDWISIGRGGFAVVYNAYDAQGRALAVKLYADDEALAQGEVRPSNGDVWSLVKYAQVPKIRKVFEHPSFVTVYRVKDVNGVPAVVMDYVPGWDLEKEIYLGPRLDKVRDIFTKAAEGLEHARTQSVTIGDIKPTNVMKDGTLIDYDIADITPSASDWIRGTISTMAPEQFSGDLHPNTDIFGLTCALYHMIVGKTPLDVAAYETRMAQTTVVSSSLTTTETMTEFADDPESTRTRLAALPLDYYRASKNIIPEIPDGILMAAPKQWNGLLDLGLKFDPNARAAPEKWKAKLHEVVAAEHDARKEREEDWEIRS